MKKKITGFGCVLLIPMAAIHAQDSLMAGNTLSLAGTWQIRMDPNNDGIAANWFKETVSVSLEEYRLYVPILKEYMSLGCKS